MGFTIFRRCMTLLICVLLLMLFIFPSQTLCRFADEAETRIARVQDALLIGDFAAAARESRALTELIDARMPALERFLNHASVDALDAGFRVAYAAVCIGDGSAAFEALAEARSVLERLKGIELFSFNSLL